MLRKTLIQKVKINKKYQNFKESELKYEGLNFKPTVTFSALKTNKNWKASPFCAASRKQMHDIRNSKKE